VVDADPATRAWLASAGLADPGPAVAAPEGDAERGAAAAAARLAAARARRAADAATPPGPRLWDTMPVPAAGWRAPEAAPGDADARGVLNRFFVPPPPRGPPPPLPPHTGFGSEADSAASCVSLAPRTRVARPPAPGDDGVILRFPARRVPAPGAPALADPSDADRRFTLRLWAADGSVDVVEARQEGFPGGRFLDRARARRPPCACAPPSVFAPAAPGLASCAACGGGEPGGGGGGGAGWYTEADAFAGATLRLHGRAFRLASGDAATEARLVARGHPLADAGAALAAARAGVSGREGALRTALADAALAGVARLDATALAAVLAAAGAPVATAQQAAALVRAVAGARAVAADPDTVVDALLGGE
jgi:hypothetical protein